MFELQIATQPEWTHQVLESFDLFLLDHASCEKKASGMAMTFVSHYPDRPELVRAMTDLAVEELTHFKEVLRLILGRGLQLQGDSKDPYIAQLHKHTRRGTEPYFLDRLIVASIVEARGHERFGLIAQALPAGPEKQFYQAITRSEERHYELFYRLAERYFDPAEVANRCQQLLPIEADIIQRLPIRAALH